MKLDFSPNFQFQIFVTNYYPSSFCLNTPVCYYWLGTQSLNFTNFQDAGLFRLVVMIVPTASYQVYRIQQPVDYRTPDILIYLNTKKLMYMFPRAVARQDDSWCETQNWHPPPFIKNTYPPASEASGEVANLTERKNPFWQEIITQTCPICRGYQIFHTNFTST